MLGREVQLPGPPQRIVSLCPSLTETLFSFGLDEQIVGLTRYCLHPEDRVVDKQKVGGTKRLDFAAIDELAPDLIIAEKEENNREDVECLAEQYPVYVTEVTDIASALKMVEGLGAVCDRQTQATTLVTSVEEAWQKISSLNESVSVAYLIWRKPWMAAGSDTFIDAVLQRMGLINVFGQTPRYPEFEVEALVAAQPDVVFLSSEPYPFKERHIAELQMSLPDADFMLVDGEAFSWYGAHMLPAARYLQRLIKLLD